MNVENYSHLIDKQVQFREKLEDSLLQKIRETVWWVRYLPIYFLTVTVFFFEKANFNEKCFII